MHADINQNNNATVPKVNVTVLSQDNNRADMRIPSYIMIKAQGTRYTAYRCTLLAMHARQGSNDMLT